MSSQGWEVRFSNSHQQPYFFNGQTGKSVWETPAGLSEDQVYALPGARQYLPASGAGARTAGVPAAKGGRAGEVRASHILAKHRGSRRPSSWRQETVTTTLPEARNIIAGHIAKLKSLPPNDVPRAFAEIASTESDCSSARKGGDLGWFGPGAMQKAFEDATYGLEVGQLSDIIESDSGVHVILRTG